MITRRRAAASKDAPATEPEPVGDVEIPGMETEVQQDEREEQHDSVCLILVSL